MEIELLVMFWIFYILKGKFQEVSIQSDKVVVDYGKSLIFSCKWLMQSGKVERILLKDRVFESDCVVSKPVKAL